MVFYRRQKGKRVITQKLMHTEFHYVSMKGMDSNTFERINLCQNTPCKDMDKCGTSLPTPAADNSLVPLHLLIIFWSLPREIPRYLALDMVMVALSN
jgi:hypothetical protein